MRPPYVHIDNFTILVCLCAASFLISVAFFGAWLSQQSTRAPLYFSASFSAGVVSCVLFLLPPHPGWWFRFFNVIVGDTFVCIFLALLQAGVRSFLAVTRYRRLIWLPLLAGTVALYYWTAVHDSMFARIIILGLVGLVVRVQIGIDLTLHAHKRSFRVLAAVMFIFAAVSLWQIVGTLFRGAPANYFRQDLVQSSVLFLYLIFLIATGLLLFLAINSELIRRLEDEAATDFLSGAFNRRGIERVLKAESERSKRSLEPLSIALVDIDSFKQINDREGHAEGDRIIHKVAHLSRAILRPYDSVGRLGGDEFVVVLPRTSPQGAVLVAERLRQQVEAKLDGVTVSIGVATRAGDEGPESLLHRTDSALYEAKGAGRNRVSIA